MEIQTKYKVVGVVILTVSAFAIGRWMAPEKIKTEIKTVEVEKRTTEIAKSEQVHKQTKITEVTKTDGTKEKVTTIDENSADTSLLNSTDSISKSSDQTKEVTKSSKRLNVSFLAGTDPFHPSNSANQMVYGASATTTLAGPFSCGVWGFQNGLVGASIGVNF